MIVVLLIGAMASLTRWDGPAEETALLRCHVGTQGNAAKGRENSAIMQLINVLDI